MVVVLIAVLVGVGQVVPPPPLPQAARPRITAEASAVSFNVFIMQIP